MTLVLCMALSLVLGWVLRGFAVADSAVTHLPPSDLTPSLAQLRAWRRDRR